jgi:hypothetical protein
MVATQVAQVEADSILPGPERRRGIRGATAGQLLRETVQISDTELKVNILHYQLLIIIICVVTPCCLVSDHQYFGRLYNLNCSLKVQMIHFPKQR